MLGFRSPSHAPCPGGALSASNPAAIQFPPPQVPADKHSGGKGNTTTGTIPSHPPAPPALGSHRIIPPCQAPPHPIWVPLTETKLPEKRHPPSLRVAVADRDAVQGGPTVWQAIPIPSAWAAAPVCREPLPSSRDGQW